MEEKKGKRSGIGEGYNEEKRTKPTEWAATAVTVMNSGKCQ